MARSTTSRSCFASCDELVEEELVRLGELGPEALVQDLDDLGERDLFVLRLPRADSVGPAEATGSATLSAIWPSLILSSR